MAENLSHEYDWVERIFKRFKETGDIVPPGQIKLYQKISDHFTQGRTVIDVGCSTGLGSNILSHNARFVWGVDVSEIAISWATKSYTRPNLGFATLDIEHQPDRELSKFEVVVVSEVIEHLNDVDAGLSFIKRMFTPDTVGFITVPNINNPDVKERDTANHLHLHHWTAGEFYELMIKNFKSVTLYSVDKLSNWDFSETVDGTTTDGLIVAMLRGVI